MCLWGLIFPENDFAQGHTLFCDVSKFQGVKGWWDIGGTLVVPLFYSQRDMRLVDSASCIRRTALTALMPLRVHEGGQKHKPNRSDGEWIHVCTLYVILVFDNTRS